MNYVILEMVLGTKIGIENNLPNQNEDYQSLAYSAMTKSRLDRGKFKTYMKV
jgi:hypothetical protein